LWRFPVSQDLAAAGVPLSALLAVASTGACLQKASGTAAAAAAGALVADAAAAVSGAALDVAAASLSQPDEGTSDSEAAAERLWGVVGCLDAGAAEAGSDGDGQTEALLRRCRDRLWAQLQAYVARTSGCRQASPAHLQAGCGALPLLLWSCLSRRETSPSPQGFSQSNRGSSTRSVHRSRVD
jgi:hypothetical protein